MVEPLSAGARLHHNRYLITRVIAVGGTGVIYLAFDGTREETVAIKQTFFTEVEPRNAFEREAKLLERLEHPGIPKVTDRFEDNGQSFHVMTFVAGEDLSRLLAEKPSDGSPPPSISGVISHREAERPTRRTAWKQFLLFVGLALLLAFLVGGGLATWYVVTIARKNENVSPAKTRRPKEESTPLPATGKIGDAIKLPSGIEIMYIPAGEFQMGTPTGEAGSTNDQFWHRVEITRPFWMGKYEVTQAQWESVMGDNPSDLNGRDLPVEKVSWDDCQKFIEKLNGRGDGYVYRLPTEAEWEYACRAGTTGEYAGNLDEMGWYDRNSGYKVHPVGQKQANAWGLCDMHGNVLEWCADWYDKNYYVSSPTNDPKGPPRGEFRVLRGGSWDDFAIFSRSAFRNRNTPAYRSNYIGFRVVVQSSKS